MRHPKRAAGHLAALCSLVLLGACAKTGDNPASASAPQATAGAGEVNLYTTREPALVQPLLDVPWSEVRCS